MAIAPEIIEMLQGYIDNWTKGIQELADTIFNPDVDNSGEAFVQSETFYSTFFWRAPWGDWMASGSSNSLYFKSDLSLVNGELIVNNTQFIGKDANAWSDANLELFKTKVLEHPEMIYCSNDGGDLVAQIGSRITVRRYDEGVYYNTGVNIFAGDPDSAYGGSGANQVGIDVNTLEYTINASGVVSPNKSFAQTIIKLPLLGIKTYPIIGNFKDIQYVSNFVSSQGAVNNYQTTYTTPDNKTITVYYGDNYIITHVNDDEPVSYNDVRNALNVAVTQINEDNDSDIKVPTYKDNKGIIDPDEDKEVDMPLNDAAFGEGLSHYYVTTVDAPVLSDISEAMSSWNINNTGKDLYRNLLSCRITKVGPIPAENSTFVIYGEELLHGGSPITINKITGNPSMDLGEYEILPKFNDFRDYAPYTKIEMFIPYCGWVALPSHVMSSEEKPKIITGTLLCDIIAGTCKAVIKCNDTVVAEASGFTAVDVPFTGENVGMKMAGIASAITSYGNTAAKTVGNIASGGMSGGAGAGAATAGGLVGLLGSYTQLHSAFNANYTEICGKTGDGCNVAGLNKVYIKIQRPKTGGYSEPDFVPEDYGHTTGFIAMKKKQISECDGLIVCANPDTSGIGGATDRERQMIKNLLESGIIVRHTEPEP